MEAWKDIIGLNGYYQASTEGRIKSVRTGIILKPRNSRGYQRVNISIDGVHKTYSLHKLICTAFHEKPSEANQINHKDGNKKNNRPENLEWCTGIENMRHAISTGLKKRYYPYEHIKGKGNPNNKKLIWASNNGDVEYESVELCAAALNASAKGIARVCRGERSSYKGLKFKYV